jgi:hypothetical protein
MSFAAPTGRGKKDMKYVGKLDGVLFYKGKLPLLDEYTKDIMIQNCIK